MMGIIGCFIALLVMLVASIAMFAYWRMRCKRETLTLLHALPEEISKAKRDFNHPDVSGLRLALLSVAEIEFTKLEPSAQAYPVSYDALCSLRSISMDVERAVSLAVDDRQRAEQARKEGPKLLAKLPALLAETEKKAGENPTKRQFLTQARERYKTALGHAGGVGEADWSAAFPLLVVANSLCEKAEAYAESKVDPLMSYDLSDSADSPRINFGRRNFFPYRNEPGGGCCHCY